MHTAGSFGDAGHMKRKNEILSVKQVRSVVT